MNDTGGAAARGLLENLPLKAFSLMLAMSLWWVVPDPAIPHLVPGVPLQLENIPADLALSESLTTTVEVHVRGATLRTRALTPGELSPRIDLSSAFAGDTVLFLTPDMINAPFNVTVDRIEPSQVAIRLEPRVRRDVPVNVVVEGSPADGYEIYETVMVPPRVTISGPESRIEQLEGLATEKISVSGRQESLSRALRVIAEDPTIVVEGGGTVQVTVAIGEQPVNEVVEGIRVTAVNEAGAEGRVVMNPEVISVILQGPPSVLARITAENIVATIDVDGLGPAAQDHRLRPMISFNPPSLATRVEIVSVLPQQLLDVNFLPQRRR